MCSQIVNRVDPSNAIQTTIHHHFSGIAPKYHYLRTTDLEPITTIVQELKKLARIEAIDIGCGTGRYDLLLCRYLGDKVRLVCADANLDMLKTLNKYLIRHGISNFASMYAKAENLPFPGNSYDCVCTFNAIHHFNLLGFLCESARILKSGGYLFIYTRFREQNGRNIWGKYFPKFNQKETRLYTLNKFTQAVASVPNVCIKSIEYLKYGRRSTLAQLVERARAHHYSTFNLYSPEELEEAIAGFTQKISNEFEDIHRIHWFDENVLFVIRKEA
ncbi:class I SAM-dependent methyltransferase [Chloroflexota bacterium]